MPQFVVVFFFFFFYLFDYISLTFEVWQLGKNIWILDHFSVHFGTHILKQCVILIILVNYGMYFFHILNVDFIITLRLSFMAI